MVDGTWGYAWGDWPWGGEPTAAPPLSLNMSPPSLAALPAVPQPSFGLGVIFLNPPSLSLLLDVPQPSFGQGEIALRPPSLAKLPVMMAPTIEGGDDKTQYSVGTIDLAAGSDVVAGIATAWTGKVAAGHLLVVLAPEQPGAASAYSIASVGGDEAMTLNGPWPGPDLEGMAYVVHRRLDGRGVPRLRREDLGLPQLFNRAMVILDNDLP